MRTYLDCIPCFFRQALQTARFVTNDEAVIKQVLDEVGASLAGISLDKTPPETAQLVYDTIRKVTGVDDPYAQIKAESTRTALALYPSLKQMVAESDDPLLMAIRLAAIGNVIDLGATDSIDIEAELAQVEDMRFGILDYDLFCRSLDAADEVLYIGDNAGESVFDRLLIEQMGKPTVFVVRDRPVINDVTHDDAMQAGLDRVATIVSSGTPASGTVLSTCSDEFRQRLAKAKFVISKGQGNFEGLSDEPYPIFFLLKVKCEVLAKDVGVAKGEYILKGAGV